MNVAGAFHRLATAALLRRQVRLTSTFSSLPRNLSHASIRRRVLPAVNVLKIERLSKICAINFGIAGRAHSPLRHISSSPTAMSQEQYPNKRPRHAPDAAAMAFPQRAFVEPTPNMMPFHPTAMFGTGAIGHQQHLPPMVPSVPFPGSDPCYPPVPQLVFPFLAPNSIVSRRNASGHLFEMTSNGNLHTQSETSSDFLAVDSTSSGLSKEEPSLQRLGIAKRGFNADHSITSPLSKNEVPVRSARDIAQERQDTPFQHTPTSASHMKRSRLPSNNTPRKAPLRATSSPSSDEEDGEHTDSGRKRPKAKQQRLSAKPDSIVKSKRGRHPSNYCSKKVDNDEFEG